MVEIFDTTDKKLVWRRRGILRVSVSLSTIAAMLGILVWAVALPGWCQYQCLRRIVADGGTAKVGAVISGGISVGAFVQILVDRDTWGDWKQGTPASAVLLPVKSVWLEGKRCGDFDARLLTGFHSLKRLTVFGGAEVTDGAMASIGSLRSLQALTIQNATVGDRGVVSLRRLTGLRWLSLAGTRVDDRGIAMLTTLPQLCRLNVAGTHVGNGVFAILSHFSRLTELNLAGDKVSDAGLRNIGGLSKLQRLDIDGTPITNAGLHWLEVLPELRTVLVAGTRCTAQGIIKLKQAKPSLRVYTTTFFSF
jgi:hypothetical protein